MGDERTQAASRRGASEASKPHSEHPGVHAETIPTRERIAKAHSRLPAEWHGWHAKLANGGYGHFAYHNAREACYICTLLDDLDSLEEQYEVAISQRDEYEGYALRNHNDYLEEVERRERIEEQLEASRQALIGFNLDGCRRMAREHEEEARRMLAGGRDTTDVAVGCIAEAARVLAMCDAIELALALNPAMSPDA